MAGAPAPVRLLAGEAPASVAGRRPVRQRLVAMAGPALPLIADAGTGEEALAALAAAAGNPFLAPGFLVPTAAALTPGARLFVLAGGNGEALAAVPLAASRLGRLAPAVSLWAHHYAPLSAPAVLPGHEDTAAAGVLAAAESLAGPGAALIAPFLPTGGAFATAMIAAAADAGRSVAWLDVHRRAIAERSEGGDFRARLPTRRRKELARQMRRLADLAPVTIDCAAGPDAMSAFEAFLALESSGWKGRRGTALAAMEPTAAFARAAIAESARRGAVRILTLRAGERPAAMLVCLLAGETAATWKIAYDEALARFSPGAQLMLEAPRLLFAEPGIRRVDSCAAPDHPMIDALWPRRLTLGTLVVAPRRGLARHRLGLWSARAERRGRDLVRRLLRGQPRKGHGADDPDHR